MIKLINKRIKVIAKYPESWKLTSYPDSRISALGNFSIVYKIVDEGIIVTAFWDNRQEPDKLLQIISHTSKNKEELPEHVIEGIQRGQGQLKKGLGKTSEKVFGKYGNKYFMKFMRTI